MRSNYWIIISILSGVALAEPTVKTLNPGESSVVKEIMEEVVACANPVVSTFCSCDETDRLGRRASLVLYGIYADGKTKAIRTIGTFQSSGIDPLDPFSGPTAIQQCNNAASRVAACFKR